ncbi:unnamed protein product [Chironomus riparius]|uniref:Uncharacterized protein n=1 Tax=Chironomus riparius TaxID=315576 RepID=A0A9N9RJ56_9DIPT|nr:unnamed protein product [Chironomus riparius]
MSQQEDTKEITNNFGSSLITIPKINGNNSNTSNEQTSIECFADNVKFTCIWKQPEVNMHIINQIMNQINIYNDNEYGDCTPSNITALISSSFPSSSTLEEINDGDNVDCDVKDNEILNFVASTPIPTIKTIDKMKPQNEGMLDISNDSKNQMLLFAFNHTSPIVFSSRHRTMYTKKKLHLGSE